MEIIIVADECNQQIRKALELADGLLSVADKGDEARIDIGCGVLFGTIRDCAYKIRFMAESELAAHKEGKPIAKE